MMSSGYLILGMANLKEIIEVLFIGVGIASAWFYIRSLFIGNPPTKMMARWAINIIPISICIAWALRILGWI